MEYSPCSERDRRGDARYRYVNAFVDRYDNSLNTVETTVAFDWVEVRSAGPWGRASGFRGDPKALRLTPAPRGR